MTPLIYIANKTIAITTINAAIKTACLPLMVIFFFSSDIIAPPQSIIMPTLIPIIKPRAPPLARPLLYDLDNSLFMLF